VAYSAAAAQTAQVTATGPGSTLIFAHSDGLSDSVYVTVREPDSGEPVATITLSTVSQTIAEGDTLAITATLRDAQGRELSDRAVSWTTGDAAIVSIEGTFGRYVQLRGLRPGTATVTATSEGKSASATITVSN
jgi:uncharacterized protein YjdB